MARIDIYADAAYGEVETTDNLSNKVIYDFVALDYVDGQDNDNYCYGEVLVPDGFAKRDNEKYGIRVRIPYRPHYKKLKVCFRSDLSSGQTEYMTNVTNNGLWFQVFMEDAEGLRKDIHLSELPSLNERGNFNLVLRSGYAVIYSGDDTDFIFQPALRQNEVFLLKAFAGNLYQYPTTGVGLIEYLHGNFENAGLAEKLQSEFQNDKMIINNAYMDSLSGELLLDVTEKNG